MTHTTAMSIASAEPSSSRMEPAEIEMLVEEETPRSRPTFQQRRWLVVTGVAIACAFCLVLTLSLLFGKAQPKGKESGSFLPSSDYATWLNANVTLDSGVMYKIVEEIPHDAKAFTQGLTFVNGDLFESTGLYRQSTVRQLDPVSGDVLVSVPLGNEYFGEGLTYVDGKLVQITWKEATAFVWNASNLTIPPTKYSYNTTKNNEGWGITYNKNKHELIVSDGSANLIFWDPDTLETLRTLKVTRQSGKPALNMNELEFWRGRVLANVWYEDVLLVIHPKTGLVEKEYDFSSLWPKETRPSGTDVLNGISVTDDPDILYVTGKLWNRMYRIKLLP